MFHRPQGEPPFRGMMLRREGVDDRAVRAIEDLGNMMDR